MFTPGYGAETPLRYPCPGSGGGDTNWTRETSDLVPFSSVDSYALEQTLEFIKSVQMSSNGDGVVCAVSCLSVLRALRHCV